jgi:predicted transcriptional regulator
LKGSIVKTLTLEVRQPADAMGEFIAAWRSGRASKGDRIAFASPELLWKVLTGKRWELLKAMCGAGPLTVREAAHRVGRDIKGVHTDLSALLQAGVLSRNESGQVEFPYQAVKVEFLLQAA